MIKNTLFVCSLFALFFSSSALFAEEPFIGLGLVQHTYKQKSDNASSEFEAEPSSYRLTLGSRIAKHYMIEAYYLSPNEADEEVTIGSLPNDLELEYEMIVGASINRTFIAGPLNFYIGPNISAAKVQAESTTGNASQEAFLDSINKKDTRLSAGLGVGLDFKLYKGFSINVNAQSYYYSTDILGWGAGAELRYHL